MRQIICAVLFILALSAAVAFGASGTKPNQAVIAYRNVSSSTKPANCTIGELKRNDAYVFLCASSHHWRRIAIGNGF